jgi:hypothetical protein
MCLLLLLLQVVYSYAFGILFFHEHLTVFGVAGTALIALGMACVTARTTPQQQQQQQGDKLSDAARDAAGAGLGSRMFSRILQLDSLPQQQGGSIHSSSSFLARMQSFQLLLADRRSGEASADVRGYQYHAAGSGETEGVGLLPAGAVSAAAGAAGGGNSCMRGNMLAVEEQLCGQHSWGGSSRAGLMSIDAVHAVSKDVQLSPVWKMQQRHVHMQHLPQQHEEQQQQQQQRLGSSPPSHSHGGGHEAAATHAASLETSLQPLWSVRSSSAVE